MTVRFYSEDGKEALEIIPSAENKCVYIEAIGEDGFSIITICLDSFSIDDFTNTLNDFKERIK